MKKLILLILTIMPFSVLADFCSLYPVLCGDSSSTRGMDPEKCDTPRCCTAGNGEWIPGQGCVKKIEYRFACTPFPECEIECLEDPTGPKCPKDIPPALRNV